MSELNINFESILELIIDIDSNNLTKDILLDQDVKDGFKYYINSVAPAADLIKLLTANDPSKPIQEEMLSDAESLLKSIHAIDANIFKELCTYTGLTNVQIEHLTENFNDLIDTNIRALDILFDAYSKQKLVIEHPDIAKLIKNKSISIKENHFDAFIEYIIGESFPSTQLEKFAKLSVYQAHLLESHILYDQDISNLHSMYSAGLKVPKDLLVKCAEKIKNSIDYTMRVYPYICIDEKFIDADGFPYGIPTIKKTSPIDNLFDRTSPSCFFDAWGIKDRNLLVYSVTAKSDFSTQDSQVIKQAYAIKNGIMTKSITEADDFTIKGICAPINYTDSFNRSLNYLIKEGLDSKLLNNFKHIALHSETLKILTNTSSDKYNDLRKHISLSLYGDDKATLNFKKDTVQYKLSITALSDAINVLNSIIDKNPTFYLMESTINQITGIIAAGLKNALSHPYSTWPANDHILKTCCNTMKTLKVKMMKHNIPNAKEISLTGEDITFMSELHTSLNDAYKNEKQVLLSGKNRTSSVAHDSVGVDVDVTHAALRSSIYKFTYTGPVSNKMFNDAIIHHVSDILSTPPKKNKTGQDKFRVNSIESLLSGMANATKNGFDLTRAIEFIKKDQDLMAWFKNPKEHSSLVKIINDTYKLDEFNIQTETVMSY